MAAPTGRSEKRRERQQTDGGTYTDTSCVHSQGQPPGLQVKGHTGARCCEYTEYSDDWPVCKHAILGNLFSEKLGSFLLQSLPLLCCS